MQRSEGLMYLIRELELNKKNDQAFDNSIDFKLYIIT